MRMIGRVPFFSPEKFNLSGSEKVWNLPFLFLPGNIHPIRASKKPHKKNRNLHKKNRTNKDDWRPLAFLVELSDVSFQSEIHS